MAIASSLRGAGGVRRSAWLHNRFWSSGARRLDATSLANALELSAHASRTSVHCVVPNSACANNGYGTDAPVVDRRPNAAADEFWARDWLSYGSNTLGAVAGAVLGEGYLVGAFRFLRLYVVSSPTAFAVMLAVVLAGIGLGGIAAGVIHRRRAQSNQLLPVLLLLAAIAVLLSYLSFPGEAVQSAAREILMPDF
jgi:hypothetical protein